MIRGILPWEWPAKHGIYRLGFCLARSEAEWPPWSVAVRPFNHPTHLHTRLSLVGPLLSLHCLFLKSVCTVPHDTNYREAHISGSDTRTNPTFGISPGLFFVAQTEEIPFNLAAADKSCEFFDCHCPADHLGHYECYDGISG